MKIESFKEMKKIIDGLNKNELKYLKIKGFL